MKHRRRPHKYELYTTPRHNLRFQNCVATVAARLGDRRYRTQPLGRENRELLTCPASAACSKSLKTSRSAVSVLWDFSVRRLMHMTRIRMVKAAVSNIELENGGQTDTRGHKRSTDRVWTEALLQQQSRVTLELTTVARCRCWYSLELQEASRCLQRVRHSKLVKILSPTSTSNK